MKNRYNAFDYAYYWYMPILASEQAKPCVTQVVPWLS